MNKKILAGLTAGVMLCSNTFAVEKFLDVKEGAWYSEYINYVTEKGIMNGMGDGLFSPSTTLSRAMIVQILYNFNGKDIEAITDIEIKGVNTKKWYYKAINWAVSNNLLESDENNEYNVEKEATREEVVDLMYKFAKFIKLDVSVGEDTNILSYNDAFDISEGKAAAFCWVCGEGIINGDNNFNLNPKANITRAETATIMKKFDELMKLKLTEKTSEVDVKPKIEEKNNKVKEDIKTEEKIEEIQIKIEAKENKTEKVKEIGDIKKEDIKEFDKEKTYFIELEGNATTGYMWEAIEFDANVIKVLKREYVVDSHEEGMVGVPGKFNFAIISENEGTSKLKFIYYRKFEGIESAIKREEYNVTVDKDRKIKVEKISE